MSTKKTGSNRSDTSRTQMVLLGGLILIVAFHSRVLYLHHEHIQENIAKENGMKAPLSGEDGPLVGERDAPDQQIALPPSDVVSPKADFWEGENRYVMHVNIPGADRSKLAVEFTGHDLKIDGVLEEIDEGGEVGRVLSCERATGPFMRTVTLPGPVDSAGTRADFLNGVLTVRIPKGDEDSPQMEIPVN